MLSQEEEKIKTMELTGKLDLRSPVALADFKIWKQVDGSLSGIQALIAKYGVK